MSKIILRRHAQTKGNLNHCYNGWLDEPICQEGIECAKSFEADLSLKKIFVSPMIRARQTAEILYPNAEQIVVEGLKEMGFGDFEGRNHIEMARDAQYEAWLDSNCEERCPNGEKKSEFVDRCVNAFQEMLKNDAGNPCDKRVLLVHGGVIMALFSQFYVPKTDYFEFDAPNCCGFSVDFDDAAYAKDGEIIFTNCETIGTGEKPQWR